MKFLITRECKYTETLEVEAENKFDALEQAQGAEFPHGNDDVIVSEEIKEAP